MFYLVSSGYLLIIREEGRKKIFLIPLLLIGGLFFYLNHKYSKHCEFHGDAEPRMRLKKVFTYIIFSLIFGMVFLIYVFIPWWIPGYKGGPLLP